MYQNSFWDTVKGQQLADILIEYLPTVAKNERVAKNATVPKRTKQYTIMASCYDVERINEELKTGAKIVQAIPSPGNNIFIVFERDDSNE